MPLVKPEIFKGGPNFALSNISALMSYAATFAVGYLMSIYLQQIKGFGADISGFILITSPAIQTFVTLFAGRLSDKYSPYILASIGMGICTIGLGSLILVSPETSLIQIFISLIILGFGFGIFSTPNTNAIMSMVKPPDYGIASSFVATMRNLGMVGSMAVITLIIDSSLPGVPLAQAPTSDIAFVMRLGLIVFTVICLIGVFTSLSRRKAKDGQMPFDR
jgi:MFS family permease